MTAEQIEKAIEKIRPEHGDINGWIVVEYKDLEIIRNTIGKLADENERLKEEKLLIESDINNAYSWLKDYKQRNEKAIKYIKSTNCYGMRSGKTLLQKYLYELLEILQGNDEE